KLGDALKGKVDKAPKKTKFRIRDRYNNVKSDELRRTEYRFTYWNFLLDSTSSSMSAMILYMFGKNHYFIFLYIQAFVFFIIAFGYVGTFIPNS
ncbi:hypothetical protein Lal_00033332, partial [Lupinus albus]